jgi:hypothetical protein
MSNLNAATFTKGKVGANRNNNKRRVSALIVSCAVAPSGLAYNTPAAFYSPDDAIAKGITLAFDKTNNANVYRHISEFYRQTGKGVELNFMLVATQSISSILEDTAGTLAKKLLISADYEVRQLGVAINPTVASGTIVDGLPSDVMLAVAKGQGFAQWAYDNFMPAHVFIEGYQMASTAGIGATVPDLRDIENLEATKVTMVVGQDWKYAETKTGLAQKFADVGSVLGVCAAAAINQNIGDNEAFNLTDATKGIWEIPGLSNHVKNIDQYTQLQTLEDKGYVFGVKYAGLGGVRINNDHVCAPVIIDADGNMNEHTIAYGRVMDDVARQLRTAYLPKVKKTYPVDANGKLPTGVRVSLEKIGDNIFADMETATEISSGKTAVDPDSDLLVDKKLIVSYTVTPTGTLGELTGTINLKANE